MDKKIIERDLKIAISNKLKQLRTKIDISLEQFAEICGMDFSSFHQIYSGKTLPRLSTLWQISHLYDLPIQDWFKDLNNKNKTCLNNKGLNMLLLHNFNKLQQGEKEFLVKLLIKANSKIRKHKH